MEGAVKQLAEWTDDLRKLVEKTPRHVISASVNRPGKQTTGIDRIRQRQPIGNRKNGGLF